MIRVIVLCTLILMPAGLAWSQTATPGEESGTVLRLVESAERTMTRDHLRAELRVEAVGANPTRLQAEINQRMAAALDRAKAVPDVKAETGGYWVYEERPKNAAPRWRGQQSLILTGTEFGALLALAGELQAQGLVFSGMSFDLRPETARTAQDELTAEALKRLLERAERVATELGLDIVRIAEIRVGNVLGAAPRPVTMRMEMATDAKAPPVAEPGEQTVQVTVEGEIVLGPRRGP